MSFYTIFSFVVTITLLIPSTALPMKQGLENAEESERPLKRQKMDDGAVNVPNLTLVKLESKKDGKIVEIPLAHLYQSPTLKNMLNDLGGEDWLNSNEVSPLPINASKDTLICIVECLKIIYNNEEVDKKLLENINRLQGLAKWREFFMLADALDIESILNLCGKSYALLSLLPEQDFSFLLEDGYFFPQELSNMVLNSRTHLDGIVEWIYEQGPRFCLAQAGAGKYSQLLFSPNSRVLAFSHLPKNAEPGHNIKTWLFKLVDNSWKPCASFDGAFVHEGRFSPDSSAFLLFNYREKQIKIFDIEKECLLSFRDDQKLNQGIRAARYQGEENNILIGRMNGEIQLVAISEGSFKHIRTYTIDPNVPFVHDAPDHQAFNINDHMRFLEFLTFASEGKLVVLKFKHSFSVFNIEDGNHIFSRWAADNPVCSPDGRKFLWRHPKGDYKSGCDRLGSENPIMYYEYDSLNGVFSPDSTKLAMAKRMGQGKSSYYEYRITNLVNSEKLPLPYEEKLAFHPNNKIIALGTSVVKQIFFGEFIDDKWTEIATIKDVNVSAEGTFKFSPDGNILVYESADGFIQMLDLELFSMLLAMDVEQSVLLKYMMKRHRSGNTLKLDKNCHHSLRYIYDSLPLKLREFLQINELVLLEMV